MPLVIFLVPLPLFIEVLVISTRSPSTLHFSRTTLSKASFQTQLQPRIEPQHKLLKHKVQTITTPEAVDLVLIGVGYVPWLPHIS